MALKLWYLMSLLMCPSPYFSQDSNMVRQSIPGSCDFINLTFYQHQKLLSMTMPVDCILIASSEIHIFSKKPDFWLIAFTGVIIQV